MKINWGIFAFGLFGSFALFMIGLAVFASMQTNELVTEDYYEKELEFKEVLKKQERTKKLSKQLTTEIKNNQYIVNFPKEVGNNVSGNIVFFKPSSQKEDKDIDFKSNNNLHIVDISNYASGMYKIRINWTANNIEYYNEEEVVIP